MLRLSNGAMMPQVGFGLYLMGEAEACAATAAALKAGYRHLDSASFYGNERGVGAGLLASGVARRDVFVATKVWTDCIGLGPDAVRSSVRKSAELLGVEYLDLVYVHWPAPGHVAAYRALEALHAEGLVRAIGLSNYRIEDYDELVSAGLKVAPVANQIECNPWLFRTETIEFFKAKDIATVAYKPLLRGGGLDDATVVGLSGKHGVSPAQVLVKWGLNHGLAVLPKSSNAGRMAQNLDVWSFDLGSEDMAQLDALQPAGSDETFRAHFAKRAVVDADQPTVAVYAGAP
ncbi:NADP-dependent oxidoreductase domain-containing protein [Pelagophyceae sp. CCMP2097]|nr:NADP-dependent oxidoreductase domain-containing protein [Pelagophyceae sp. CCMP2097]